MQRHERLSALLDLVMERGQVRVEEIVTELGVSPATARRDLDALAEQQLVRRTRGGATTNPGSSDLPLRYKATRHAAEKTRIARAAVDLVRPGDVVAVNGGTTTLEVARELAMSRASRSDPTDQVVTVVTNAVNIAAELAVRPHLRVVVTGGVVRSLSYELTGPLASLLLPEITIDVLFLGVNAFDPGLGAASHDEGEAAIAAALIERSRRVVVVADASKLGRSAFARICDTNDVEMLVTTDDAEPGTVAAFTRAGVRVLTA